MKILFVDDMEFNHRLVQRSLNCLGVEFLSAKTGREALTIINQEDRIDLVIADMGLEDVNGIELLQFCQGLNKFSGLYKALIPPFIMLTSSQEINLVETAKKAGYIHVIQKPYDSQELVDWVRRIQTGEYLMYKKDDTLLRILVIDHEAELEQQIQTSFKGTRHSLYRCTNSKDALTNFQTDLDISAIMIRNDIPGENGIALFKQLKGLVRYNDEGVVPLPPILLTVSGSINPALLQEAKTTGFHSIMMRPVSPEALSHKLAEFLQKETHEEQQEQHIPKILVVDDVGFNRNIVERVITKMGYRVVSASSGIEALQCLRDDHKIDVVISDLMMPDISGIELLETYQQHVRSDAVKNSYRLKGGIVAQFVMMTSCTNETMIKDALSRGYVEIFRKPVDTGKLRQSILSLTNPDAANAPVATH